MGNESLHQVTSQHQVVQLHRVHHLEYKHRSHLGEPPGPDRGRRLEPPKRIQPFQRERSRTGRVITRTPTVGRRQTTWQGIVGVQISLLVVTVV